ncbi:hypothetical protein [Streptomonospora sediminis]
MTTSRSSAPTRTSAGRRSQGVGEVAADDRDVSAIQIPDVGAVLGRFAVARFGGGHSQPPHEPRVVIRFPGTHHGGLQVRWLTGIRLFNSGSY